MKYLRSLVLDLCFDGVIEPFLDLESRTSFGSLGSVFNYLLLESYFEWVDEALLTFFDINPDFSLKLYFFPVLDFISEASKLGFLLIFLLNFDSAAF